jgi:hypothetical protein
MSGARKAGKSARPRSAAEDAVQRAADENRSFEEPVNGVYS